MWVTRGSNPHKGTKCPSNQSAMVEVVKFNLKRAPLGGVAEIVKAQDIGS